MPEDREAIQDSEPDESEPEQEPGEVPDHGDEQRAPVAGPSGFEVGRVFESIQSPAIWAAIGQAHAAQTSTLMGSWLKSLEFPIVDTGWLSGLLMPDLTKWIGDTSGYSRSMELIKEAIAAPAAKLWTELAPTFELLKSNWLPANLREIDDLSIEDLVSVADDGITLYAVPRASIAKRILAAPDRAGRRRILGGELPRILDDCDAVLDRCVKPQTRDSVVFTRKAIAAARASHLEAAQALGTNTLDTTIRKGFEKDDRVLFTSHKQPDARDALDKLAVRKFMVIVPIWHAYSQYTPDQVDPIPWTFNRHVNSHGVNARQFNRPNMAQGAMLLTGLVALLNDL
jgi:hypothetical protein